MRKKILVTGSNGLLGQKITDYVLQYQNVDLIATGLGKNRHPQTEGYVYEEMDVLSETDITTVINKHKPHAIIHTAAMTNVDVCETEKIKAYDLNVNTVSSLIRLCEEHQIQLVHLSTDFIFDGADGPYKEDAVPNPLSFYGETKLQAERFIKQSNIKWTILRTIIVYGVVQDMSRSNIVLWAKGALEKGNPINVVNDQWRMPTLAEDLAWLCVQSVLKETHGIYNASGSEMFSILELVQEVAKFWQLDASIITPISAQTLAQAAPRPIKTGFILDKTIRDLEYKATPFVEGLRLIDAQLKKVTA